jgi:hypothetical protein
MSVDGGKAGPRAWAHWRVSFRALAVPFSITRMEFTSDQPYADPEKAARKLVEIANAPKGIGQIVNRTLRLSGSLGATRWRMAISNYPLAQLN